MKASLIIGLARAWRVLSFIWFVLVFGVLVNVGVTWLTAPRGAVFFRNTPIGWLIEQPLLLGSVSSFLLLLTLGAFLAQRKESQRKVISPTSYNDRMIKLTQALDDASKNVDGVLQEMAQIIQEREKAITTLEEKQMRVQQYVESLQKGPAESLKIFQEILEEQARQQDKESRKLARRYFIYGALVTLFGTAIGVAFTIPSLIGK